MIATVGREREDPKSPNEARPLPTGRRQVENVNRLLSGLWPHNAAAGEALAREMAPGLLRDAVGAGAVCAAIVGDWGTLAVRASSRTSRYAQPCINLNAPPVFSLFRHQRVEQVAQLGLGFVAVLELSRLDLGSTTPRLAAIKTYDASTDEQVVNGW